MNTTSVTVNTVPSAPTAGTHTLSATQIIWNWNTVSGATGYKWNTTNNYVTATDMGASTSKTETGLTCETAYTRYVWAYNACGNSTATTLNQTTSVCPFTCGTATVTFTYRGSGVTYGTVVGVNAKCWLDRNLGATQVATSKTDAAAYGDLFQWGRLDDNHQDRTSGTTTTLSGTNDPGHSNFITIIGAPNDWRSPQNNSLWQGESGINNPCPSGWRLPTDLELTAEKDTWSSPYDDAAFASPLKLVVAGRRGSFTTNGILSDVGDTGYYWSYTTSATLSKGLIFYDSYRGVTTYNRGLGMSVRCIKD